MIKRELYLNRIRPFYKSDLIKVLIGIRRCGKSILLKQIIQELNEMGVPSEQMIYLNFEDYDISYLQDPKVLHEYVKSKIRHDDKYYLFLDEIQVVKDFEKVINSLRSTLDISIFITGSNGQLLSGELATLLSGRYVKFRIFPFTFNEVCTLKNIPHDVVSDDDILEFAEWGGLPQRFQFHSIEETKIFLADLYRSIVLRDIMQRSSIKDTDLLDRVIDYLVQNPSQIFSYKSIANYFESINRKISTETLYTYLQHISNALIIEKAPRYDIRGKKILTKSDKIYLGDAGLGRIRNSGFKVEIGSLLENVVYIELCARGYDVYVGKTNNSEIDFIAVKDKQITYYQVCYLLATQEVVDREFNAYSKIGDNYPKYVISMDRYDFSREGIIHLNLKDFLLPLAKVH